MHPEWKETEYPGVGVLHELVDNETGERITVDASSARFRELYKQAALNRLEQQRKDLRRMNIDCVELVTGRSIVEPLTRFFMAREARL